MLPLIATRLLESIALLDSSARLLADNAIAGFTVNESRLLQALHRNPILATTLNPHIGYLKAAEVAKKAYRENRPVIDVAQELTTLSRAELECRSTPCHLPAQRGVRAEIKPQPGCATRSAGCHRVQSNPTPPVSRYVTER
jgi:fumarate hydratase class II